MTIRTMLAKVSRLEEVITPKARAAPPMTADDVEAALLIYDRMTGDRGRYAARWAAVELGAAETTR